MEKIGPKGEGKPGVPAGKRILVRKKPEGQGRPTPEAIEKMLRLADEKGWVKKKSKP